MSLAAGRHAGVLLPLFSMPSTRSWGIGEILDIPEMARWLRRAGQDLLQLLPINEMAVGQRSPYSAMTAMAIDPIYISVHAVPEFDAIGGEAAMSLEWRARLLAARQAMTIDHAAVRSVKEPALRAAHAKFLADASGSGSDRYAAFRRWAADASWWLHDYALFRALHARERDRWWREWPEALRDREPRALSDVRLELADEIAYREWLQWLADSQWRQAKQDSRPVALFGDLSFMVDGDSADVWTHASSFRLDAAVGAPPDAFSEEGQNWGMPAYLWERMVANDFPWLRARARRMADLFDGYRVDHLVGFYRTYMFPADNAKAFFSPADENDQLKLGEAVMDIFMASGARIIAEDLGTVPDFVRASLSRLGLPGYRVFRWERYWNLPGRPYRNPQTYPAASVATTGTHDTDPISVWWEALDVVERAEVLDAPGLLSRPVPPEESRLTPALRDAFLESLFASGSDFLLLPMQDVFGWHDRINVPGSLSDQNWTWRLPWPVDRLDVVPEASERATMLCEWSRRHSRLTQ